SQSHPRREPHDDRGLDDAQRRGAPEALGHECTREQAGRDHDRDVDAAADSDRRDRGVSPDAQVAAKGTRMATTTASAHAVPSSESGLWSWITTVDHKRIGALYGVTAFVFFLVGGLEAL